MRVVVGQARARREDPTSLVVRVGAISSAAAREQLEAAVTVSIAEPALARAMIGAIAGAMTAAGAALSPSTAPPIVRLRTRKRLTALAALGPEHLAGAIAVVRVTERNARRLLAIVETLRAARVRAVQMVWDGNDPPRSLVERHVFAVLERARATPGGPPVLLAASDEPVEALRILGQQRNDRS